MIFVKNRLIFGIIKGVVTLVFKVVYGIIRLFCLQLPVLVGIVGLVLFVAGAFKENSQVLTIFYAAMGGSIFISLIMLLRKIFKKSKVDRKKNVQIMTEQGESTETTVEEQPTPVQTPQQTVAQAVSQTTQPTTANEREDYPKYYAVRQNRNYVMAEYEDRYILYHRTKDGLKEVRTDYK